MPTLSSRLLPTFHPNPLQAVTANRKKNRKAVFTAPSHQRRILMSAPLSKELRLKYKVKSVPIRKDDEVKIVRGDFSKTQNEGKVTCVYRKRNIIQVNGVSRDRNSGTSSHLFFNSFLQSCLFLPPSS